MKTLYLRIYLTVVAVLLLFAMAAGWLAHQRVEMERDVARTAWSERAKAWADLLENSLPPATAPVDEQREALLAWAHRLRLAIALDDARGERIATSEPYLRREARMMARNERTQAVSLELADGRRLWVMRSFGDRGDRGGPEVGGPGSGPGMDRPPHPGVGDHLPPQRPAVPWFMGGPWWGAGNGGGLLLALVLLFLAIAAGAYPVVRRLTRRLESLRSGVETFGAGDLSHRVDAQGRDEVAAVATSFNQAAERIESLVRANQSLLANASHELRSPLARLKMAVAMLADAPAARAATLKREIDQDIKELDALVEEVLMASRLDAKAPLTQEQVDLLGIAVEEGARVGAAVDGSPVSVMGDERLLRRAVRNLMENAQRYGQGKPVDVQVGQADGKVTVRVEDRGPGVPADQRERIFEAFYRLPGHAEMAGGVGLGLSLVRQITQRHGGDVRCEAREGGGSAFVVTLPTAGA